MAKPQKANPKKFWLVERHWLNQMCCILASGPSMSQAVADAIRPTLWRTACTNTTFRLAPWSDLLYAADNRWWAHPNNKDALAFQGLKATIEDPRGEQLPHPDILVLRNDGAQGFTDDRSALRHGSNSGYQAIHLSAHLGATRIILCGFDMRAVKDKQHWHTRHPPPLRDHGSAIYAGWIQSFGRLAPELTKRGIEVINCTPDSALRCFPMMPLDEAVERWSLQAKPASIVSESVTEQT